MRCSPPQEFPTPVPPASDPVRFAYRVPNVSGGLVTSTIEQRTDWGYDHNRELAVLLGFLHRHEEIEYFGRRVLPLVREPEAQEPQPVAVQA